MSIDLRNSIADVPNFPKDGIVFRDVSPLLADHKAFAFAIGQMKVRWEGEVDVIAALDARGFIFGGALALSLGLPMVMLRKKGKLPGETVEIDYGLEYGSAVLEVQAGAFEIGARVLIIDDLLATGGTARAARMLVERLGARVVGYSFVAELADLGGRSMLGDSSIQSLVIYEE